MVKISPEKRKAEEVRLLRSRVRELEREVLATEDVREFLTTLKNKPVKLPSWQLKPPLKRGDREVPVLFTSDFQWGETIRGTDLPGNVNDYSPAIARQRYRTLVNKTIEISRRYTGSKYPGLIYLRGGDAISGDIHDDLTESNAQSAIPAILDCAAEEAAGIQKCVDEFGQVVVISVPGNHGRTTKKPRSKHYADLNYETVLAYILEREFAGNKNVTFYTPQNGDAYFPIYDIAFLLTHGDRIGARGGTGFIGPVAVVAKGVQKVRQQYAALGFPIDYVLMGHFHTPTWLQNACVNGCLAGFSEFASSVMRAVPAPPSQWLFFVHPEWGITARWELYLEKPHQVNGKPWTQVPPTLPNLEDL